MEEERDPISRAKAEILLLLTGFGSPFRNVCSVSKPVLFVMVIRDGSLPIVTGNRVRVGNLIKKWTTRFRGIQRIGSQMMKRACWSEPWLLAGFSVGAHLPWSHP